LLIVAFYVLLACKCVLYYCHQVTTQLQLTSVSVRHSARTPATHICVLKSEGMPRRYLLFRMQPERTIRADLLDALLSPNACYADLLTQ